MKINILSIGTEILIGDILNTNLQFVGRELEGVGFVIAKEVCVADIAEDLKLAVLSLFKKDNILITIGGLGPTSDDITRDIIFDILNKPTMIDQDVYLKIENYLLQKKRLNVNKIIIEKQATVIKGAEIIPNNNGTAPGIWFESKNATIVMLPGPPSEFKPMIAEFVVPKILSKYKPQYKRFKAIILNVPEPIVEEKTVEILKKYPSITPEYCAGKGMVKLRLSSLWNKSEMGKEAFLKIKTCFGKNFYEGEDLDVISLIADILKTKNLTLATAESCTGGMIASKITDISGASDFFKGSIVTYSNDWKVNYLNINPKTLEKYGAVSAQIAKEMLLGLKTKYDISSGISVTGIAGPNGGTKQKPVGLVYIGTFLKNDFQIKEYFFKGRRENIREKTLIAAINQLYFQLL